MTDDLVTVVALQTFRYQHGKVSQGKRVDVPARDAERLVYARKWARFATPEEVALDFPEATLSDAPLAEPPAELPPPTPDPDPDPPITLAPPPPDPLPDAEPLAVEAAPEIVTSDLVAETDADATTEGSPEPQRRRRRYRRRDLVAEE